jgi:hypothetical protein
MAVYLVWWGIGEGGEKSFKVSCQADIEMHKYGQHGEFRPI